MQFVLTACRPAPHVTTRLYMPTNLSCPALTLTGFAQDPSTWSLVDGSAPPGQFNGALRMIVMTSPNASNFSEFVKGGRQVLRCAALRPECHCLLASCCCCVAISIIASTAAGKEAGSDRCSISHACASSGCMLVVGNNNGASPVYMLVHMPDVLIVQPQDILLM